MSLAEDVRRIEEVNSIRNRGYSEKKILLDNLVSDCYNLFRVKASFFMDASLGIPDYIDFPLRTEFKPLPYQGDFDNFCGYNIYEYKLSKVLGLFLWAAENRVAFISGGLMMDEFYDLHVKVFDKNAYKPSIEFAAKYRALTGKKVRIINRFKL